MTNSSIISAHDQARKASLLSTEFKLQQGKNYSFLPKTAKLRAGKITVPFFLPVEVTHTTLTTFRKADSTGFLSSWQQYKHHLSKQV